jgi:hypothetical protein
MKKSGIILSLTLLVFLMSFSTCFAAGLQLEDSYPKNGSHNSMLENVVVKLYFNEDVSAKEVQAANKDAFEVTDAKGKALQTKILYPKQTKEIWVLVEETLISNTDYKLKISGDLQMVNGDTLGKEQLVEFTTRNTSVDSSVNMGLMAVMMVGMIGYTSLSAKRQLKKQEEEAVAEEKVKVNPYKVAKETGKSVEQVVAKTEKEKEKARAQAEKKNKAKGNAKANEIILSDEPAKDTQRVTGPKPITAAGSTYKSGRKEKAEQERQRAAAKTAAGTTRPKNATGKSKNKKTTK